MTEHQFWYGECCLLQIYEKAYINRIHNEAYVQGAYFNLALSVAMSNAFRKQGTKAVEYPNEDVFNPFKANKESKPKSYISSIDTSKSNKGLYQIKKMIEERRKLKDA